MQDWNHIPMLLAIVETGSVTEAAARLGLSAATVSRRLAALEADLGRALVERGPGRFVVTPLARAMVAPLQEAELAVGRAVQLTRQDDAITGTVRVAAMPLLGSEFIAPHLARLRDRHPDLRVELMLHHRMVNLGRGDADIAVRGARPTQENLVAQRLSATRGVPLAARSLLERAGTDRFDALPWIGWPEGLPIAEARWIEQHVPEERIVLRIDDLHTQARAAESGAGVFLASSGIARCYRDLVPIQSAPPGPMNALWLAAPAALRQVPRVAAVWDFLIDGFAMIR